MRCRGMLWSGGWKGGVEGVWSKILRPVQVSIVHTADFMDPTQPCYGCCVMSWVEGCG